MRISQRAIGDLSPSAGNPRIHDQRGVDAIAASIRQFGFRQPLVVRAGEVIVGNGRLAAAKQLGIQQVPCVDADDLSDEQAKALRAADNRLSELSGWDADLLADDLRGLDDDLRIGWEAAELEDLIGEIGDVEDAVLEDTPESREDAPQAAVAAGEDNGAEEAGEGDRAADEPLDMPPAPRRGPLPTLRAPFPYSGGKRRWANEINARLGIDDVQTYCEPFAGSLAVLLSRPPARREVVCDTYSLLTNAWRALVAAPDEVATWADFPTHHDELVARRRWLGQWAAEHGAQVAEDVDYCDARAAGYWIWTQSQAIGGSQDGVRVPEAPPQTPPLQSRPAVGNTRGAAQAGVHAGRVDGRRPELTHTARAGKGVQAQRRDNRRPELKDTPSGANGVQAHRGATWIPEQSGRGVQAQRGAGGGIPGLRDVPAATGVQAQRSIPRADGGRGVQAGRSIPSTTAAGGVGAGRGVPQVHPKPAGVGVQSQITTGGSAASPAGGLPSPERWGPWFAQLAARLKQVIVLNRPWESGVTPAVLGAAGGGEVAILMDPPYVVEGRSTGLYASDSAPGEDINRVAAECHAWALANGDRYRIAYCFALGSFQFPRGWTVRAQTYTGGKEAAGRRIDAVAFSPKCLTPPDA